MYLVQYSMPFPPLLAGHHSNQNHHAAPPGPAVAPPLLVPSQAPVSAPTVKSHFTSTLPPSYQQQYAYKGILEAILRIVYHSVVPYIPTHQGGLVSRRSHSSIDNTRGCKICYLCHMTPYPHPPDRKSPDVYIISGISFSHSDMTPTQMTQMM
jgi:hypothetical protein